MIQHSSNARPILISLRSFGCGSHSPHLVELRSTRKTSERSFAQDIVRSLASITRSARRLRLLAERVMSSRSLYFERSFASLANTANCFAIRCIRTRFDVSVQELRSCTETGPFKKGGRARLLLAQWMGWASPSGLRPSFGK